MKPSFRSVSGTLSFLMCGCLYAQRDGWADYNRHRLPQMGPPAILLDSRSLVFWSPSSGCGDIYRCRHDGSQRVRLTSSDAFEAFPVSCNRNHLVAFVREENGMQHVWIMDANAKQEKRVTSAPRSHDLPLEFSPNGQELLFLRGTWEGGRAFISSCHLLKLSEKIAVSQTEAMGDFATFAPDGQYVVYCHEGSLWEWDRKTGDRRKFKAGAGGREIVFAPNGRTMLFTRRKDAVSTIWLTDRLGESERFLAYGSEPCFTSNGTRVVFKRSSMYGKDELFVMKTDGAEPHRLPIEPGHVSGVHRAGDGTGFYCWYMAVADSESDAKILFLDESTWTFRQVCSL